MMHVSTKKWLFTKISSAVLIPLVIWFLVNFVSILKKDEIELLQFLTSQPSKLVLSVFLVIFLFFFSLTISEIFEDYLSNNKIKNVANKLLYFFAITFPLITIFSIHNL